MEAVRLSGKATRWWAEDREVPVAVSAERGRRGVRKSPGSARIPPRSGATRSASDCRRAASGRSRFAADRQDGHHGDAARRPWVAFELFEKLKVDSARWDSGEPATVFKGKDSASSGSTRPPPARRHAHAHALLPRRPDRALHRLLPDQGVGGLVPALAGGRGPADLRSHLQHPGPSTCSRAWATGGLRAAGHVSRPAGSRRSPIRNASFNLGLFKDYTFSEKGAPPVTVMVSEEAHKKLADVHQQNMRGGGRRRRRKSLKFFQECMVRPGASTSMPPRSPSSTARRFRAWCTSRGSPSRTPASRAGRGLPRPRGGPPVVGHRRGLRQLPRPVAQ